VGALVVVGGDGTVHLGFNALAGSSRRVPLGIIPTGTGNDMARRWACRCTISRRPATGRWPLWPTAAG